ncbi:MaoC/PaaZ C-terminal domain-containing protein [Cryptosporangium phraense]|uniref:MaoC/PaaZ C-terminal domain-containing protein n=1 Tax=Cryptosporangium phraense TaxID=2593070 RepID=UPI00197A8122|nr:MaoC/PaaZ C-terminal domain-containing protein [Cryptosporangium phraense]
MGLLRAEDLTVGAEAALGRYTVTADEIVEFGRQWDPQTFHVDPVAAADSYFGEVIASGLHTLGVLQRLAVLGVYQHWDVIAGRRIRSIELTAPVTGGMTLAGTLTVESVEPRGPERALVTVRGRLRDAADERPVLEAVFEMYLRRAG